MSTRPLLLYNGTILTMDPDRPRAEAVLLGRDKIEWVGTRLDSLSRGVGSTDDVRRIDLGGGTVIPGFNDNHLHALIMGDHRLMPDLTGLDSKEIVELISREYRDADPGELVLAYGWDYPSCPEPRRDILDRAFPYNPVIFVQFSGHGIWVNTRTLEAMDVPETDLGPDFSGPVERDGGGRATGIIRETKSNPLLAKHFTKISKSPALAGERLERALEEFRRYGITSFQDNTWLFPVLLGYRRLRRKGRLTGRVSCWRYGNDPKRSRFMGLPLYDGSLISRGPWKYILDGSFSTGTAWLTEPYAGGPGKHGNGTPAKVIEGYLDFVARKKKQGAFHAIGDRQVGEFLDAVESICKDPGRASTLKDLRLRLEHAQLIREEDIPRIRDLGILVAAQPSALISPEKDRVLLGNERALRAYPYRTLIDAGVRLSFGSDIPGERVLDPLHLIHMAVNREGDEAITPEEALRCYTAESAYAEFEEDRKGMIRPGMLADLTVLSANPLEVGKERIKDIEVEMTLVGARVVYDRLNRETASGV
jgi:predicted amidohydrolase YtcJ